MFVKVEYAALLLFVISLESHAFFISEDLCSLTVDSKTGQTDEIDKEIPEKCRNGSFEWRHPAGTAFLHFTDPYRRAMTVCVKDNVNGNIFIVRDVTDGYGFPSIIGRGESCTMRHDGHVVLRLDAPSQSYLKGSLIYEVFTY